MMQRSAIGCYHHMIQMLLSTKLEVCCTSLHETTPEIEHHSTLVAGIDGQPELVAPFAFAHILPAGSKQSSTNPPPREMLLHIERCKFNICLRLGRADGIESNKRIANE